MIYYYLLLLLSSLPEFSKFYLMNMHSLLIIMCYGKVNKIKQNVTKIFT